MPFMRKKMLPVVLLFFFINTLLITTPALFQRYGIDRSVVIIANALLFLSNVLVLFLQYRSMQNSNPNVFVRSKMLGTIIKLILLAGPFVAYVFINNKNVNKPAIYISIFLYFVYLAAEVATALKINKQKNA
jgi:hypothetical protein